MGRDAWSNIFEILNADKGDKKNSILNCLPNAVIKNFCINLVL